MATKRAKKPEPTSGVDIDVAIIGAGAAGLYTAWRLLQDENYKSKKICVFDAAPRIGGRILSVKIPEIPFIAEMGAMRYTKAQVLISSLIENRFHLDPKTFQFDTHGYKLRNRFIRDDFFDKRRKRKPAKGMPYRVEPSERGLNPNELIVLAIRNALKKIKFPPEAKRLKKVAGSVAKLCRTLEGLDAKTPKEDLITKFEAWEWRFIRQWGQLNDRPLHRTGFWELVQTNLRADPRRMDSRASGWFGQAP